MAATGAPHLAVITSTAGGKYTVHGSGGTSASAPLWAGLIALADQYAGRHLGFVTPALYRIGRSVRYRQAFHDVTAGSNTVRFPPRTIRGYRAATGWDTVTGWGAPPQACSSRCSLLRPGGPADIDRSNDQNLWMVPA